MTHVGFMPFIKWAGGKTQLLDVIRERLPASFDLYYEPFIGGGAVFLKTCPQRAYINDINPQLINVYKQIKNEVESLITYINFLDNRECNLEFYLEQRDLYNKKIINEIYDVESAGLLIWLNKHCFNGLYRVNKKGLFNVPYNKKIIGSSIVPDNVRAISEYFNKNKVIISCSDFEEFCDIISTNNAFVYLDSPYVPMSETASFTDYSKSGFLYEDHKRLADLFKRLDQKGVRLMLSNNDVKLVRELYEGYIIESIDVKRNINSRGDKRWGKEVIIRNYE